MLMYMCVDCILEATLMVFLSYGLGRSRCELQDGGAYRTFVSLTTGRSLRLLEVVYYVNYRGGVSCIFFVFELPFVLLLPIFILRVSYVYPTWDGR